MPGSSNKLTLPRIALYLAVAVAAFILLRFVFSVAMSAMKFIFLGALAVFVVYLFLGKDKGTDGTS
ncbi:MAG TPA: hypothetical protein PK095_25590 [Myxococcota bacterium]|nr:hypothetical protein [Myxococcota bacterium]